MADANSLNFSKEFQRYDQNVQQKAIQNLQRQFEGRGNLSGLNSIERTAFQRLLQDNPQLKKELGNVQEFRQQAQAGGFSNVQEYIGSLGQLNLPTNPAQQSTNKNVSLPMATPISKGVTTTASGFQTPVSKPAPMANFGAEPFYTTPAEFKKLHDATIDKYGKLVKEMGLRQD